MSKSKGRKVEPAQPGERKQYAPGVLERSLAPDMRKNIEALAVAGQARDGRGILEIWKNDALSGGVEKSRYHRLADLLGGKAGIAAGDRQPIEQAVRSYDLETQFVAIILDVTRTLPGPQLWFEVFSKTKAV